MFQTQIKPSSQLRNNYPEMIKLVQKRDPVIITNNGKAEAVLINVDDYADFERYMHLRYVHEKLAESKKSAADPDTKRLSHKEVWERLGAKYGL